MSGSFSGLVCATLTPLTESLEVDRDSLYNLADYLIENGVNALFPVGTNGEGFHMDAKTRCRVAELFIEAARGRVPVVVHTGALTTEETIDLTLRAKELGAQGAGVIVPYFYRLDQTAIENHYRSVARAAGGFPIYLYNLPALTGQSISFDVIKSLSETEGNIAGLKYSTTDFLSFYRYLEELPDLPVFIGCDEMILPALKAGCAGTVSGGVNCYPDHYSKIFRSAGRGDADAAVRSQHIVGRFSRLIDKYPEFAAYKAILQKMKILHSDAMIPPLRSLNPEEKEQLFSDIEEVFK